MPKTIAFGFTLGAALAASFNRTFASAASKIQSLGQDAKKIKGDAGFKLAEGFKQTRDRAIAGAQALGLARKELTTLKSQANGAGGANALLARRIELATSRVKTLESAMKGNRRQLLDQCVAAARAGEKIGGLAAKYKQADRALAGMAARQAILSAGLKNRQDIASGKSALAGQVMEAGAAAMIMGKPVKDAMTFGHGMQEMAVTGNMSNEDRDKAAQALLGVSRDTNRSPTQSLDTLKFFVGKGMDMERGVAATRVMGKTATAASAEDVDVSTAGYAMMSNLKIRPEDLERAMGIAASTGKAGGYELKDMSKDFPDLSAKLANMHMEGFEAIASAGAFLQVALEGAGSGAEAATNFKNFLTKATSPETVKNFAEKGINLEAGYMNAVKSGHNPLEYLVTLVANTTQGNEFRMGELFGDMQVGSFLKAVLPKLEQYRKIKKDALSSDGIIERDFTRMMESPLNKMKSLGQAAQRLGITLGGYLAPTVGSLGEGLASMANWTDGIAKKFPSVAKWTLGIGAGMVSMRIALLGLKYGWLFFRGGVQDLKMIYGGAKAAYIWLTAGGAAAKAAAIGSRIAAAAQWAWNLACKAGSGLLSAGRWLAVKGAQLACAAATTVATGAQWAFNAALTANPIGLAVAGAAALAGAAWLIYDNWEPISSFFSGLWSGISDGAKSCWEAIKGMPLIGRAAKWVSGDEPAQAGAKVQQTMAAGVASEKGALAAAMGDSFDEADAFMPHSDADKGPFSRLTESGRALIQTLALGAAGAGPSLAQTLSAIFGLGAGGGGLSLAGASGGGGGIVLNVSIGEIRAGDPGAVREAAREGLTAAMPDVRRAFEDYLHSERRTALAR